MCFLLKFPLTDEDKAGKKGLMKEKQQICYNLMHELTVRDDKETDGEGEWLKMGGRIKWVVQRVGGIWAETAKISGYPRVCMKQYSSSFLKLYTYMKVI